MICSVGAYHCLTLLAVSGLWRYCEVLSAFFVAVSSLLLERLLAAGDTLSSFATAYYRLSSSAGHLDVLIHMLDVRQFIT